MPRIKVMSSSGTIITAFEDAELIVAPDDCCNPYENYAEIKAAAGTYQYFGATIIEVFDVVHKENGHGTE